MSNKRIMWEGSDLTKAQLAAIRYALNAYKKCFAPVGKKELLWPEVYEQIAAQTDIPTTPDAEKGSDGHELRRFRKNQIQKISRFAGVVSKNDLRSTIPQSDVLTAIIEFLSSRDIGLLNMENLLDPEISLKSAMFLSEYIWDASYEYDPDMEFEPADYTKVTLADGAGKCIVLSVCDPIKHKYAAATLKEYDLNRSVMLSLLHGWVLSHTDRTIEFYFKPVLGTGNLRYRAQSFFLPCGSQYLISIEGSNWFKITDRARSQLLDSEKIHILHNHKNKSLAAREICTNILPMIEYLRKEDNVEEFITEVNIFLEEKPLSVNSLSFQSNKDLLEGYMNTENWREKNITQKIFSLRSVREMSNG